jgi:hypothetical protein
MPINYKEYPSNWKTEIRPAVLERANNKCEDCGVENYDTGYRDVNGVWFPVFENYYKESKKAPNGFKLTKIILTIAHLDHDKLNHDVKLDRLKALCQRCHLKLDINHHVANRKYGRKHKDNNHKLDF